MNNGLYNATEVADMVGITVETLKTWEARGYVPIAARLGLQKKRVWSSWKVERILDFARDNGYPVPNIALAQN